MKMIAKKLPAHLPHLGGAAGNFLFIYSSYVAVFSTAAQEVDHLQIVVFL